MYFVSNVALRSTKISRAHSIRYATCALMKFTPLKEMIKMIEKVIVTSQEEANEISDSLKREGHFVIRICISSSQSKALFKGGGKDKLILHFADIEVANQKGSFRKNQARKIKNFILNHHKNSDKKMVLVINCVAGQSRSTAIGRFCESLGINTTYTELEAKRCIFPNKLVLRLLKIRVYDQDEYHPAYGFDEFGEFGKYV